MQNLWYELRHGLRGLTKAPVLTATIVLTVGLGIGATTVLSSIVYTVLLKPLPYDDAAQLVQVYLDRPPFRAPLSVADYLALEEHQTSFEQVEGYTFTRVTFQRGEVAERVRGRRVTPGYFSLLGVEPALGSGFDATDGEEGREPAVILSHGFWTRHLGADASILGRTVRLDGVEHRVAGILPRHAGPLEFMSEIFVAVQWGVPPRRGPFFIRALARLRPGVDHAAAGAEVQAINERIFPLWEATYQDRETAWKLADLKEMVVDSSRARIYVAFAAVALVLLIACANAANLLVARAMQRRRELAIRGALGASRQRLLAHLLSESAWLAAGAVGVGVGLTFAGLRLATTLGADYIPRSQEIAFDGPSVSILLTATLVSGLLFAVLPALFGARLGRHLSAATRGATSGMAAQRLRQGLVVAQFAVATPLLVTAGLLFMSLDKLGEVDLGVESERVLTAAALLTAESYPEASDVLTFWERAREKIAALPGVEVVGYADGRPPNGTGMSNNFFVEEVPTLPGKSDPVVPWVSASPEYFTAMGISLVRGRLLDERDGADGLNAIVVDQAWERRFFPDGNALSKRIRQGGCESCAWATVVGVVTDVEYNGLERPNEGVVYWPLADRPIDHAIEQITQRFRYFVIRAEGEPLAVLPSVRGILRELDPALPLSRVATVDELVTDSLEERRYLSAGIAAFALVALLLSVIGIYGVMSYFVEQHTRDIGIRIALGGRPAGVGRMIVGRGMRMVALGLAAGIGGAFMASRFLASLLFEVGAYDAGAFAGVVAAMLAAAFLSCLLPAGRAARIDPAITLRDD